MGALFALIIAYLLGSLSMSVIFAKIMGTSDPRTAGSGSAGATNVLRTAGKQQAILVLIGDVLKGLIAIWIAHLLHVKPFMLGLVGLAAVMGHIYPVFFGFKGGKGVATAVGAIFGLSWVTGFLIAIAWAAIAIVTRYASLASIVSVILAPVFLAIFSTGAYFIPAALIAAIVIWKHKDNIARLQSKTENKITL